jgi:hypothetical protein
MQKIKQSENIALSNYEIDKILDGQTKILTYKALPQFENIEELLEPFKNFILLYMFKQNYGHWCCVLQHPDRIEFFDPYGGNSMPDEELDLINKNVRMETNQNYPYLSKLIYESGFPVEYNDYKFQKHAKDIKTCGRHCIVRVLFKDLLLDDYYKFIKILCKQYKMTPDQLVTYITTNLSL